MPATLSSADAALLAFEEAWPRHSGAKEELISARLRVSAAQYYLRVSRLLASEGALAYDPMLVRRLRRIQEQRLAERVQRVSRQGL